MPIGSAYPAAPVGRIALLGNYPPRLCGIATFTADVRSALLTAFPRAVIDVYAMDDGMLEADYPREVVGTVPQNEASAYAAIAQRIVSSGAEILCVQHEYGIFGGEAGERLLDLLDAVSLPIVVTLHTILENPNPAQRRVLDALAARASRLIVMAEKGRAILERVHGLDPSKITVIPHGIPDRPLVEPMVMKPRFGFGERPVILTFGLLSPGKGIETMVRAMPDIVRRHPQALYVILGATHPHLVRREGERYRESLALLASELGVKTNVRFVDGFVETPLLLDYLAASDIYATPYLNEAQITSGTLSYAVGLGKPVVSTPYWHATELLADGVGVLCPFGDSEAFAASISSLLADNALRDAMRKNAWLTGRSMIWPRLAEAYMREFSTAITAGQMPQSLLPSPSPAAHICLTSVERMSDDVGIIQHAVHRVPDRSHGYCTDDNARALMLMHRVAGDGQAAADVLAWRYAAYLQHAWNPDAKRFRNFMGYDRSWLEREGSEDSHGRAVWALALTAKEAREPDLRAWGAKLFEVSAPALLERGSLRTQAFAILAGEAMFSPTAKAGSSAAGLAERLIRHGADVLMTQLPKCSREGWRWFETALAYDNARLPEALLRAGRHLGDAAMTRAGIDTLDWLTRTQSGEGGVFRAVGTDSIARDYAPAAVFDQQPLEAWATVDACALALEVTGDPRWLGEAGRAHAWFGGSNDLGIPLATDDGGCFDGLVRGGVNRNQGAESILAYGLAQASLARAKRAAIQRPQSQVTAAQA